MAFSAGQILLASDLNAALTRIVDYADRTSNSSTATITAIPVLRIDSIPIINGNTYTVHTTPLIFDSTVAGDLIEAGLWVSTSGAATVTSTHVTGLVSRSYSASLNQETKGLQYPYVSSTTGNLSVLLSVVRSTGTGNVRLNASATYPMRMWVTNEGPSQADTGIDL